MFGIDKKYIASGIGAMLIATGVATYDPLPEGEEPVCTTADIQAFVLPPASACTGQWVKICDPAGFASAQCLGGEVKQEVLREELLKLYGEIRQASSTWQPLEGNI